MLEKTLVVGPFQCNCRLLTCPETGDAALIDPGDESGKIMELLKTEESRLGRPLRVRAMLHTHAHLDHIGATRQVKEALCHSQGNVHSQNNVMIPEIWLHRSDEPIYQMLKSQGSLFGLDTDDPLPIDRFLEDNQELRVGTLKISVIHTPGHSPGSVCFRLHEDSAQEASETVYTGDTLFNRSIGRTDLWGGDTESLLKNIRERLFTLDDDTRVCPGHGENSSIGAERTSNPFFR